MDVDASPTLLHCCYICDGPETSAQKLMKALPKGYSALLGYAEAIGNSAVLERIKEACKVGDTTRNADSSCTTMLSRSRQSQLVSITSFTRICTP